jgi:hypothetical protein
MRILHWIAVTLVVAAPAMAAPMSPLARETAIWNAVKAKQMDVFAASMPPNFVGVYAWGTHDRAEELRVVRNQTLRSFAITNFRAQMVDADNMLTTYTADVRGTADNKSFSGRYWNTSLWHRSGGKWLTVYHGEVQAK